jgi:phenylalanyl-tRNA synthetase alpha chain
MNNEDKTITIDDREDLELRDKLKKQNDPHSQRLTRLLALPDLTRKKNSPLKFVVDKIIAIPRFKDLDIVQVPEIVSTNNNFDLLNTPLDHPSRRETDTYYVDKSHILRTQTTVMWPYYFERAEVRKKLEEKGEAGVLCYGKTYRKDEIDRSHFPVFHQIDGVYICKREQKEITKKDLEEVLVDVVKSIFGPEIEWRFLEDTFPFTDPSTQIEVKWGENWLETVGAGIVHTQVLKNLGLDPKVYNGWAFGFGLERLAMIKMQIPDIRIFWSDDERITRQFKSLDSVYQEVSKYPPVNRDISFIVDAKTSLNNYYEIVRDCAGDLVEETKLLDKYQDEKKFGKGKISYTFRIIYRSHERTLENSEVNKIQEEIRERTVKDLGAVLR